MEKKETKLCKYCQTEIPSKAKVCPNCKRKQGGIGCLGVVLLVLGVFIFIGSFGSSMSKDKNPEKVGEVGTELSETGTQTIDNTFNVGDVVETIILESPMSLPESTQTAMSFYSRKTDMYTGSSNLNLRTFPIQIKQFPL